MGRLHRSAPQHGCNGLCGAGLGGLEEHITDVHLVRDIVPGAQIRVHLCPHCGSEVYWVVNVAENMLAETRAGRARSHACGDPASTPAAKAGASGVVEVGTTRGEPFVAIDAGSPWISSTGGSHIAFAVSG